MDILEDLNPRQREAATHTGGPLLVLAGAGSGKTRVLAQRIAFLIQAAHARPSEILAVTFTNKAAGEMIDRVRGLVGNVVSGIWMGTFHSVCARFLRKEGRSIGISPDFTIYDEQDQMLLMRSVLGDLGLARSKITPQAALARVSWAKANLLTPEEVEKLAGSPADRTIAGVYSAYEGALRASNALDFDDLIAVPVRLFAKCPEVLERNSRRLHNILIDEYQDTNRAQYQLVKLLSSSHRNVCAVGDDDQSIYRWRGADISNILNFERDFPDAKVIRLEQSYRSTKTILAASQAVICCNKRRKEKSLWTENDVGRRICIFALPNEQDEGRMVADTIASVVREERRRHSEFVVLYRTNAQSRSIEDAFRRSGMPYVIVGGIRFYERREIKDIVAYLKLIANPRDAVSLARIINVPNRGIGEATVARITEFARAKDISPLEAVGRAGEIAGMNRGMRQKVASFRDLVADLAERARSTSVGNLITLVAERSGYLDRLKEQATVDAVARTENIKELVASGFEFEERSRDGTLEKFLEEISLIVDIDMWDDRKDAVSLMTLHNAKGLEFPVVFIAGVEEGLVPHHTSLDDDEELEEERRLFYVGLTRARERVFLSLVGARRGFHGWMPQVASRFVQEIPRDYLEILTPVAEPSTSRAECHDWDTPVEVRLGTRIRHPDWGVGCVVARQGFGRDLRLTVRFAGGVTKRIMATYANLELVEDETA